MKKHLLTSGLVILPLLASIQAQAADFNVSTSSELRTALITAQENNEDDRIVLADGTYTTTDDGYSDAFTFFSSQGDSLTLESTTPTVPGLVILDGANTTAGLSLRNAVTGGTFILKGLKIQNSIHGLTVFDTDTKIKNSVFTNNTNEGSDEFRGAAILSARKNYGRSFYLTLSNSTVSNNQIKGNSYQIGGAVYFEGNTFDINDSDFFGNTSSSWGAALTIRNSQSVVSIQKSSFKNNQSYNGGAIDIQSGTLTIKNASLFEGNIATKKGGAINSNRPIRVSDTIFKNNKAVYGGAINAPSATITNSEFNNNAATGANSSGGAIYMSSYSGSLIQNSVFKNNDGGTANSSYSKPATLFCDYCTLIGNVFSGNNPGADIYLLNGDQTKNIIINNIFTRLSGESITSSSSRGATIFNNIIDFTTVTVPSANILRKGNLTSFTSLADLKLDADFKPQADSPAINAGLNDSSVFTLTETDKAGNARIAGTQVDIGPYEFGSSALIPVIQSFAVNAEATQLRDTTFTLKYKLATGKTLTSIEFDAGDGKDFTTIELNSDGEFTHNFTESGLKALKIRITDDADETVSTNMSLTVKSLSTALIIQQVEQNIKATCTESPEKCLIDTSALQQSIKSACVQDPESCNIALDGYRREGKKQCINDPSSCGINVTGGKFNFSQLPILKSGWILSGTGQAISNMAQFTGIKVVWSYVEGSWKAYSPNAIISKKLTNKHIAVLTRIPAGSGFWIKK